MANQLQDTSNYILPFCRYQASNVGVNNMPMIGIANIVRNIILAPPLTWRFNRNSVQLVGSTQGIQQGVQDYTQSFTDFGFLEKAVVNDGTTTWEIKDILNTEALAPSNTQARPQTISVQNDDGAGNITFRLSGVPNNSVYTIYLVYQKSPVQFTALNQGWAPIPDSYSDIYNNLCLGYYMDSCQDPRASQYISRGIASLLSKAEGLSEMDKAIFAAAYTSLDVMKIQEPLKAQQGLQAHAGR